jgi:hypothetical protein
VVIDEITTSVLWRVPSCGGSQRVIGAEHEPVVRFARRLAPDHHREVDHPPADALSQRAHPRPRQNARRVSSLPWGRWRAYHLDLPNL